MGLKLDLTFRPGGELAVPQLFLAAAFRSRENRKNPPLAGASAKPSRRNLAEVRKQARSNQNDFPQHPFGDASGRERTRNDNWL